ncbi:MAG: lipid A deacylase LpxR family protein [Geminicoccaceae bacterium]
MHHSGRLLLSALVLELAAMSTATFAAAEAADGSGLCDVVSLQLDNDAVAGTDRHYTGGLRLACVTSEPRWLRDVIPATPDSSALTRSRATYSIGQSAFTPDDLAERELIEDDHPYAGWLYLGLGLEREVVPRSAHPRYLESLELQLGVVGPLSGVEELQSAIHDLTNATDPQGWGNQLDNEPGINLFYGRQWTGAFDVDLTPHDRLPDLFFDVTPELSLALGNIHIFGAGGVTFRLGNFLPDDHGPPVIRPSLPGSDYFPPQEGFSAYVFGGLEGRVVGRNIFLDGNTFQDDGPSVDKNRLVGEARLGLALTFDKARIAYTHVYRSQEFEGQPRQTFGALSLSLRL